MEKRIVETMDTSLRDGEQMPGSSYSPEWKLRITQALFSAGVDRVEVASARGFSTEEESMLKAVTAWAGEELAEKIEVLAFVDGHLSVDWVRNAGGRAINLLCKGSLRHCKGQLGKDAARHAEDIAKTIKYARSAGISVVNIYLEDWSQGMADSPEFVFDLLNRLPLGAIDRVMLCDTLGTLVYWKTEEFVGKMVSNYPQIHFDFHGHNDYGLATANSLAAIRAGAHGLHVTVNGIGERTGNAPMDEVVVSVRDHLSDQVNIGIKDQSLRPLSKTVAFMMGRRIAPNKPVSGKDVFSNTAGVHADGDRKGGFYEHPKLKPSRFGARVKHPMGKLSGRANILLNLERLGWQLSAGEVEKVLHEVVKLSESGRALTIADLPYIVSSVLDKPGHIVFEILDVQSISAKNRRALTSVKVRYLEKEYELYSQGSGGFDAFMKALRKLPRKAADVVVPKLVDYNVGIPPGGREDAPTEVTIEWEAPTVKGRFQTRGFSDDQVLAAFNAAETAMNLCNCVKLNGR